MEKKKLGGKTIQVKRNKDYQLIGWEIIQELDWYFTLVLTILHHLVFSPPFPL